MSECELHRIRRRVLRHWGDADHELLLAIVDAVIGDRTLWEMINGVEESLVMEDGYHTAAELQAWRAVI